MNIYTVEAMEFDKSKDEPTKEAKYKPFSSTEKAIEAIRKHGGWVKSHTGYNKEIELYSLITGIAISPYFLAIGALDEEGKYYREIKVHECWYSAKHIFEKYVFADDGSPCGELVEE